MALAVMPLFGARTVSRQQRSLVLITIEMDHRETGDQFSLEYEELDEETAFPPSL